MKILFIALVFTLSLTAGVYKAKVEPYDRVTISSETSGRIVQLDQKDELKTVNKKVMIIDHKLESLKLENGKKKLKILKKLIAIKQNQYDRIKDLKGQSRTTKERYKSELLNLLMQRSDLENSIAALEDLISKKEIFIKNRYLKKLYVRKGAFVAPGVKLMDVEDHSGSRIVIYVDAEDRENIRNKKIKVQGERDHGYEIEKAATSTDERYLSSYRVELVKEGGGMFGKVVTIEIGEE